AMMGQMNVVPVLGKSFNEDFPVMIVVLVLCNLLNVYSKIVQTCGLESLEFDGSMAPDTTEVAAEGRRLVERERRKRSEDRSLQLELNERHDESRYIPLRVQIARLIEEGTLPQGKMLPVYLAGHRNPGSCRRRKNVCKGELPMSSPENTGLRCKVTCDREKVVVTPPRPLRILAFRDAITKLGRLCAVKRTGVRSSLVTQRALVTLDWPMSCYATLQVDWLDFAGPVVKGHIWIPESGVVLGREA
ncbi:unnamed protein product, partial [Symbiodinium natans]